MLLEYKLKLNNLVPCFVYQKNLLKCFNEISFIDGLLSGMERSGRNPQHTGHQVDCTLFDHALNGHSILEELANGFALVGRSPAFRSDLLTEEPQLNKFTRF